MSNTTDDKQYEIMVILRGDLGEEGTKNRLDKLRQQLKDYGEITHEELWGMRDLAYTIKKQEKGYYAIFDFTFDGAHLKEMDRTLRLETEVLRHLVTVLPKTYKAVDYTQEPEEEEPADQGKKRKRFSHNEPIRTAKPQAAEPAKAAVVEEKPKAPAPKAVQEESPKAAPKKKDQSLEEVDAKLKSIIDNPDLNF